MPKPRTYQMSAVRSLKFLRSRNLITRQQYNQMKAEVLHSQSEWHPLPQSLEPVANLMWFLYLDPPTPTLH